MKSIILRSPGGDWMQLDQLKRREFITLVAWPPFGVTHYNLTGHKILFVPSAIGGTCQTDQCAVRTP